MGLDRLPHVVKSQRPPPQDSSHVLSLPIICHMKTCIAMHFISLIFFIFIFNTLKGTSDIRPLVGKARVFFSRSVMMLLNRWPWCRLHGIPFRSSKLGTSCCELQSCSQTSSSGLSVELHRHDLHSEQDSCLVSILCEAFNRQIPL